MEFSDREHIINDYHHSLQPLMEKYNLDDIGIYEEEGPENSYYIGYTIRKDGHVYMINLPYIKNNQGELAVREQNWTIQSENNEKKGFTNLDRVFEEIQHFN